MYLLNRRLLLIQAMFTLFCLHNNLTCMPRLFELDRLNLKNGDNLFIVKIMPFLHQSLISKIFFSLDFDDRRRSWEKCPSPALNDLHPLPGLDCLLPCPKDIIIIWLKSVCVHIGYIFPYFDRFLSHFETFFSTFKNEIQTPFIVLTTALQIVLMTKMQCEEIYFKFCFK